MDNTDLREHVIDAIVKYLYEQGKSMDESSTIRKKAKETYFRFNGNPAHWNSFYDGVRDNLLSETNGAILLRVGKSNLDLTDLGRKMGEAGGYIKYKSVERAKIIAKVIVKGLYYLSSIIVALSTINIIHFSKSHEIPVPSIWFILSWVIIGGLLRDVLQYLPKLLLPLFRRK